MSFSSTVKNEICHHPIEKSCCILSELSALVRTTGLISLRGNHQISLDFSTENAALARRIYSLLKRRYNMPASVKVSRGRKLKRNNTYKISYLGDAEELLRDVQIIDTADINPFAFNKGIPFSLLEEECCKRSYVKGVFLGCGSISDPEKGYHLEFVNNSELHAQDFSKLLTNYNLKVRIVVRKNYYVNYLKESEQIVDVLNIIGAYTALLQVENIRIVKEMRNNINRVINCETANLSKTIDASLKQIDNINIIKNAIGLDKLPAPFLEAALVRLDNPDISLKELGEMLNPPITKSGVNHRFKKIEEIAEKIIGERSIR